MLSSGATPKLTPVPQNIITTLAELTDITSKGWAYFVASRLFTVLSRSERVAFAGQIALARFHALPEGIPMVFRNASFFVNAFFSLLFESYKFPVAEDKWLDFFNLVDQKTGEHSELLQNYFNNPPPDLIAALTPLYAEFMRDGTKKPKIFIGAIAFPFVEVKNCSFTDNGVIPPERLLAQQRQFRELRGGENGGVMQGFLRALEKSRESYQPTLLAPDSLAKITFYYNALTAPEFGFSAIWIKITSLQKRVHELTELFKLLIKEPASAGRAPQYASLLSQVTDTWQQFYRAICQKVLSFEDSVNLTDETSAKIERIVGPFINNAMSEPAVTKDLRRQRPSSASLSSQDTNNVAAAAAAASASIVAPAARAYSPQFNQARPSSPLRSKERPLSMEVQQRRLTLSPPPRSADTSPLPTSSTDTSPKATTADGAVEAIAALQGTINHMRL